MDYYLKRYSLNTFYGNNGSQLFLVTKFYLDKTKSVYT